MSKEKSQLKSGVVLSYLNLIIGNLVPFVYTPLMLSILGQAEYGLYTLAHTIVGYLSLLSFGMGSAVIRYITKYKATGEKKKMQQMFGLFTFLFSVLAFVVLILGVILSFNIQLFYGNTLSDAELSKMRILIILCTINSALTFVFTTYSSIVLVFEKYVFRQILNLFTTVLSPCANIIVLILGFSSIGMVLATTGLNVLGFVANIFYCSIVLKVKPEFRGMPFDELKSIFSFCFFVFIASVVDMLFWATDKVIIGATIGTVAVAVYNIGATFNSIVTSISTTISGVLTPRITNMVFKNATNKELTDLFIKVGRLQYIVVALVLSGFIVFGRQFINIWVGPDYAESYYVALLTLIPVAIPLIQNTGISIVTAQNKHRFRSIVYLIIAIVNAVSTYFIVGIMGIIGAAVCSAVSYIIGQGLIMNWYYWKKTGIDIPLFWKNIMKMSLAPVVMLCLGLAVTYFVSIDSWFMLFTSVFIFIILYIPILWFTGMNNYEKETVKSPLNIIIKKVKRK
ncbi:oligosaccharide flippase family protein [uncultured Ruminococcus sp.]|uniref:oligosaccharide flippase family protein n=1 Tax=uncultured Ruminococcus sp. TaxID=165186 RepID=UPI0025D62352|nr:oligosaccharide flippase family protein [uncultured Ruminococcus sp.]